MTQRYRRFTGQSPFYMAVGLAQYLPDSPYGRHRSMTVAQRKYFCKQLCSLSVGFGAEFWTMLLRSWTPGFDFGRLWRWWQS